MEGVGITSAEVKEAILARVLGLLGEVGVSASAAEDALALCRAWAALEYGGGEEE